MYKLLEEKHLPSTLPEAFKQVSSLNGEINGIKIFLKLIHVNNSYADLWAEELGAFYDGVIQERHEHLSDV